MVLDRAGLIPPRKRRRPVAPNGASLAIGFGQASVARRRRPCHPMRSDPVDGRQEGRAAAGLSRLAVTLISASAVRQRMAPGRPRQNGRRQRLHRISQRHTTRPPAHSLAGHFERFRWIDNGQGPRKAWASCRRRSRCALAAPLRRHAACAGSPETRLIRTRGAVRWQGDGVFIRRALTSEPGGRFPLARIWPVKHGPVVVGTMRGRQGLIRIGTKPETRHRFRQAKRLSTPPGAPAGPPRPAGTPSTARARQPSGGSLRPSIAGSRAHAGPPGTSGPPHGLMPMVAASGRAGLRKRHAPGCGCAARR